MLAHGLSEKVERLLARIRARQAATSSHRRNEHLQEANQDFEPVSPEIAEIVTWFDVKDAVLDRDISDDADTCLSILATVLQKPEASVVGLDAAVSELATIICKHQRQGLSVFCDSLDFISVAEEETHRVIQATEGLSGCLHYWQPLAHMDVDTFSLLMDRVLENSLARLKHNSMQKFRRIKQSVSE